ncbi:DUF2029 domain-containing protein [Streptacidiphilus sp. 4-A2]|nr:DUF2029 domain-containing protein [Streptacidiphilus sp. 4-A2]
MRPALVFLTVGLGSGWNPSSPRCATADQPADRALVLYDLTRPDSRRSKGVAIGLAAAIKITPGLFAVYLLLSGRGRAAVTAGLSCLATILARSARWCCRTPRSSSGPATSTTPAASARSTSSTTSRCAACSTECCTPPPAQRVSTAALSAVVAVFGLAVAVAMHREAGDFPRAVGWSVLCCAITALLISPISWTHHWVWCVPLLVLLAAEAAQERARAWVPASGRGRPRRRWRATAVVATLGFCSFAMWLVPHKGLSNLRIPYPLQPVAAVYPLLGLAFLLLAGERLRRHRRRRRRRPATTHTASVPSQESGQGPVQVQALLLTAGRDQS